MHNAFDKTYRSFIPYFSTILTSKFGIKDKNHAPDKPTGPAPTTKIDFFVIFLILSTIIINFESEQNKIQKWSNRKKLIIGKILPKENKKIYHIEFEVS